METEIWKPVVGYEGLYEVSNLGKVKSINQRYKNAKILTPSDSHGYLIVTLSKNRKAKRKSVHRLVAMAFLDNPQNYPVVNHKNEIRNDNRVENLEWCDTKYNVNYFFNNHPKRREDYRKNFTGKDGKHICPVGPRTRFNPVALVNERYDILEIYESASEAGRKLGIKADDIYQTCKRNEFQGKYKKKEFNVCRGYIFLFLYSERLNQFERNRELIFSYKNTHLCDKQKTVSSSEMT